jgi:hypothetical protein
MMQGWRTSFYDNSRNDLIVPLTQSR